jgi:HEPN domain-containing protein
MINAYLVEWIRKAEEDYNAAIALARQRKKSTPNALSFHCQQCAEKYLKAYLIQQRIVFPKNARFTRASQIMPGRQSCLGIDWGFTR